MKSNSISRLSMFATPVMIVSGLLASGSLAAAQSNYGPWNLKRCSDRTVAGDYGFTSEGVLLPAPGVSLQFRSAGVAHFDGKGNLTWVEHTIIGGVLLEPGWTSASGTYAVNPDCTGTAVVNTPNSPVPLNLGLVIVKQGSEVRTVLDSNAVTTVFTKVD